MLIVLTTALVVLALGTVVFATALFASRMLQRGRARSHIGIYRVRIGAASGRGRDGIDLDEELSTLGDARDRARQALTGEPRDDEAGDSCVVAFILAERDDGDWDVVDRIDVL